MKVIHIYLLFQVYMTSVFYFVTSIVETAAAIKYIFHDLNVANLKKKVKVSPPPLCADFAYGLFLVTYCLVNGLLGI